MRKVDPLDTAPPPRRDEWVQSPTLPLPPPRDRDELNSFLEMLAAIPVENVEAIRAMFTSFDDRASLAGIFNEALGDRPCGDVGRFMLLLSATGELADLSSLEVLHDLIWTADTDLLVSDPYGGSESTNCVFPASGMIQARAVEMFAWIAARAEDERILRIVAEHPSLVTRLAAADAYLFAWQDDTEALQRVLEVAQPEDRNGIGVPRLVRDGDREAFIQAVDRLQQGREGQLPDHISLQGRTDENTDTGAD